jgi:pseudolysin
MTTFTYRRLYLNLAAISLCTLTLAPAFAAKPVDVAHAHLPLNTLTAVPTDSFQEISHEVDFNGTTHTRLQQMYKGYPVMGADIVSHSKGIGSRNSSMNGVIYQSLNMDLSDTPAYIFEPAQADKAFNRALQLAKHNPQTALTEKQTKLMVYVDKNNQAHWVYRVSYMIHEKNKAPAKPTYIMDAVTFTVYAEWDDVQTLDVVQAGGFGGNRKTGVVTYDGLKGHLPAFTVLREPHAQQCYLRDNVAIVRDTNHYLDVYQFNCPLPVGTHNNIYWDGGVGGPDQEEFIGPDAINGGFSPSNDAYYAAHVITDMYQKWYHVQPLMNPYTKQPMEVMIFTHDGAYANAVWTGRNMILGDGDENFYPLSSLDVIAHEISHGFSMNHAVLEYWQQSGGINESFSDMASQTAEYYATGSSDWLIGKSIYKQEGRAFRYMNDPIKDCYGRKPGDYCSIDNVSQYYDGLNVHHSSGVFNKVFYLMSTAPNWDVKKAFGVMVQANMYYWTYETDFNHAACGVVQANKDYGYDAETVVKAFAAVGIEVGSC